MDIFSVTAVHFKTYLFTTYFYSGHYGIGMVSKRMYFKVHFQVIHWHYTMGRVLNQKGVKIQFQIHKKLQAIVRFLANFDDFSNSRN